MNNYENLIKNGLYRNTCLTTDEREINGESCLEPDSPRGETEIEDRCLQILSSPELKAQMSFSDHFLSVVCLSLNFSHFHLLFQNHWASFNQT